MNSDQIKARLSAYFQRVYRSGPTGTLTLFVRALPENKLRYTLVTKGENREETLQNILNINALEAGALALTGSSKQEAENTVHQWLLRGLTDEATEQNQPLSSMGLVIMHNLSGEQKYWVYVNGKPVREIQLNQLINKYQTQHG